MPQWMEGLIAGWPMIAANVPTFVVIVALIAGSLWAAFNWSYGRVIATKDGQIELQDRQLADYRKQLEGATPDQARAKIEEPEDQVRDTVSDAATKVAAPPKGDIDSRLAFFSNSGIEPLATRSRKRNQGYAQPRSRLVGSAAA